MEKKEIILPKLTPEQIQYIISRHSRKAGLKGGATMKKRSKAYFREIGQKGAKARWDKKKKEAEEALAISEQA